MFTGLLKKEIAGQILSSKFAVMTLLVLLLSAVSTTVMLRDFQLRMDNYELLAPKDDDTVALRRPVPMSVLVKGLDERMGRSITVEVMGLLEVGTSQSDANRLFALFHELDFLFIAQVIMSLAAVLFSFDMISGEKRRGTLKMMLANGISRSRVLLAKFFSALSVVAIPAVIAMLFALLYMQFLVPHVITGEFYLRAAVFLALTILYLGAFVAIGLLISSLTHRPAVSLVFAILVWALLVFVIPNATYMTGRSLAGGESLEQQEVNVRHIWTSEIFKRNNSPGPEKAPWAEVIKKMAGEMAAEYQHYINLSERRIGLVRTLSFLSPAGPFDFASWAAAGTGPEDSLNFKRDVLRYQSVAVEDAMTLRSIARNEPGAPTDFKARPFEQQPRTLAGALLDEIIVGAGALALMGVILFAASFFIFSRYDVR